MATAPISSPRIADGNTPTRRRSQLDIVMLVGLSVVIVANVLAMVTSGHIIPPVLITTIAYMVCAILVLTGWRWAMIFPLVLCTLGIVGDFSSGFPQYTLAHPSANYIPFVLFVIEYPLLVMVIVTAAIKLAQTLRRETPRAPQWARPALGAMAGLMLGAFLIGVISQPATAGGAPSTKAGTQTVHLTAARFAPDIIALHKGDTLTMVDDAPTPHTITNGIWNADNKPVPSVEPGAPIVKNVDLNNNTATVGPFTAPGTYHIYCTLHPGMSLTIIVQ
jgi:plastocyanin